MKGDIPSLIPFLNSSNCPLDKVNFFGDQYSKKYGDTYFIWHWYSPVVYLLYFDFFLPSRCTSNQEALKEFYADQYDHIREKNFSCSGSVFKLLMGESLGVTWGKERYFFVRNLFAKYFASTSGFFDKICLYSKKWVDSLIPEKPTDLHETGIAIIPLRIIASILYGDRITEERIEELKKLIVLHNDSFMSTRLPETKLPLYQYFPTEANRRAQTFVKLWEDFHLKMYKEMQTEHKLEEKEDLFSELAPKVYLKEIEFSPKAVLILLFYPFDLFLVS